MNFWKIHIQAQDLSLLHEPFLSLTFFERRLREAKKYGIEEVKVILEEGVQIAHLPAVNQKHCARWVPLESHRSVSEENVQEIPLWGIIDSKAPFTVLYPIEKLSDFKGARRWFKKFIVDSSQAGWVAKHLNKPLSLWISQRLVSTWVTPNAFTFFNWFIGLASGYLVAQQSYLSVVLGGLLFQIASVLDGVDGEIAKFRLEYSQFGAWFDSVADNSSFFAFLFGVGYHTVYFGHYDTQVLVALSSLSLVNIVLYFVILFAFVSSRFGSGSLAAYDVYFLNHLPTSDPIVWFSQRGRYIIKKDFFSFFFFVLCACGLITALLPIITLASSILILCVVYLNRRYRAHAQSH